MISRLLIIFVSILIVLVTGSARLSAQATTDDLKEKRISIHTTNAPLYDVFVTLMYDFDVPIGFEESSLDTDHNDYYFQTMMPPEDKKKDFPGEPQYRSSGLPVTEHLISLNFADAPLQDVLDEIVKQMENYDWTINNDVINIYPIKGRDPILEKLLNLRIRGLKIPNGMKYETIQTVILFNLPEFTSFLEKNGLFSEKGRYEPSYSGLPFPTEIQFSDLTFHELLNGITKVKRGGWAVRMGDKLKRKTNRGKKVIDVLI